MLRNLTSIIIILFQFLFLEVLLPQEFQFQQEIETIPVTTNDVPVFSPFTVGFSVSNPTFADIDNDADMDLFVGEFKGILNFYLNTGTASDPLFVIESDNFATIDVGDRSSPIFADIDDDGDLDLFVGEDTGTINFYRNTGTTSNPIFSLETETLASIDVGERAIPTFADIDNDGDLDLFVGERDGNINFYQNTGTVTNPTFILVTENLVSINVGSDSAPVFADIDNDGDFDLFIGEDDGNINFYRNTGSPSNPIFTLETDFFALIDVGNRSKPTFSDLDNDGDFDLLVGSLAGNIHFYRNTGAASNPSFTIVTRFFVSFDIGSRNAPTFADIDNDGDLDLLVGEEEGNINFLRNTGTTTQPAFTFETELFASIDIGLKSIPALFDIDNDGDLDLFVGEDFGNVNFFRNTGTAANPSFTIVTETFPILTNFSVSKPIFADIDDDSDLDFFMGGTTGHILFFRNTGTAANPNFVLETEFFASIDLGPVEIFPTFADMDKDGDLDLFLGKGDGTINFYKNTGTATNPNLVLETENFATVDVGFISAPTFVDIDNDGDIDLFVGASLGGLHFYRNITSTTAVSFPEKNGVPKTFDLGQNYPNPFNPETTIQYQLPKTSRVRLTIYNILGQHVVALVDKQQQTGFYSVQWDGKDDSGIRVSSGVYLYRFETEEFVKVRKLDLVR